MTVRKTTTLADLLTHLYVLIPVFDNRKHYWVGEDEMEKLLAKGEGWLAEHPEKEEITRRYLKFQPSLFREALARLVQEEEPVEAEEDDRPQEKAEEVLEKPLSLNEQRLGAVVAALRASGAKRVLDLGCGEGKLIRELLKDKQFEEIVGLDVSIRSLEVAQRRLKLDRLPTMQANRLKLIHGSLMYRDKRLEGFDAAAVVEVVEHLDPPRLSAFERVLFEFARPRTVVLTTPNREYNVTWETLPAGQFRHPDHRFEWTRQEFQGWAKAIAGRFGYAVRFLPVGPEDEKLGPPTQMGVFDAHGPERGLSRGSRDLHRPARGGQIDLLQGAILRHAPADQPGHAEDPAPGEAFPASVHRDRPAVRRGQHEPDTGRTGRSTSGRRRTPGSGSWATTSSPESRTASGERAAPCRPAGAAAGHPGHSGPDGTPLPGRGVR